MVSRVIVVLVCLSWWSAGAFQFSACRATGLQRQICGRLPLYNQPDMKNEASGNVEKREKSENIFQELLRSLVEAFPWLMTGSEDMDPERVIDQPPKFIEPKSAEDMRKDKKSEAAKLSRKEVVDEFIRKYLPFFRGDQNKPHDRSTALDGDEGGAMKTGGK